MFREIIVPSIVAFVTGALVVHASSCLDETGWNYEPFMDCLQTQTKSLLSYGTIREWRTWENVDPVSKVKIVGTSLESYKGHGFFGEPATFVIRCTKKELEAYITFQKHIGLPHEIEYGKNMYLIFGSTARRIDGTISTDYEGIFIQEPTKKGVRKLLRYYADSDETILVASTKDSKNKEIRAHFDLQGMQEALVPVAKACRF